MVPNAEGASSPGARSSLTGLSGGGIRGGGGGGRIVVTGVVGFAAVPPLLLLELLLLELPLPPAGFDGFMPGARPHVRDVLW